MNRREALKNSILFFGYAITAPMLAEILSGCKNNDATGTWQPSLLSTDQLAMLAEFGETILPKTGIPGSKDMQLERFIDQIVFQTKTEEEQKVFLTGLNDIERECKKINGKFFVQCSQEERNALVAQYDAEPVEFVRSVWGMPLSKNPPKPSYYYSLKGMLLWGYFTSEAIGKHVLRYDPVPGKFEADIPLSDVKVIAFE